MFCIILRQVKVDTPIPSKTKTVLGDSTETVLDILDMMKEKAKKDNETKKVNYI